MDLNCSAVPYRKICIFSRKASATREQVRTLLSGRRWERDVRSKDLHSTKSTGSSASRGGSNAVGAHTISNMEEIQRDALFVCAFYAHHKTGVINTQRLLVQCHPPLSSSKPCPLAGRGFVLAMCIVCSLHKRYTVSIKGSNLSG